MRMLMWVAALSALGLIGKWNSAALAADPPPAVQQAEVKMLRSSVERLSKENGELKKQLAELKAKADAGKGSATATRPIKVVYVLDAGASMATRFDVAQKLLRSGVLSLPSGQAFNVVITTTEETPRALRGAPVLASDEIKKSAAGVVEQLTPRGETRLLTAIQFALDQQPDVVHVITDGGGVKPHELTEQVKRMNALAKAKIHTTLACCAAEQMDAMKGLWKIAQESGGICTDDRGVAVVEEPKGWSGLFKDR